MQPGRRHVSRDFECIGLDTLQQGARRLIWISPVNADFSLGYIPETVRDCPKFPAEKKRKRTDERNKGRLADQAEQCSPIESTSRLPAVANDFIREMLANETLPSSTSSCLPLFPGKSRCRRGKWATGIQGTNYRPAVCAFAISEWCSACEIIPWSYEIRCREISARAFRFTDKLIWKYDGTLFTRVLFIWMKFWSIPN